MRKFLLIILLTIVVVGLGVGAYFYLNNKFPLTVESVLPQDPLAYVKFSNTQKNLEKWTSTQFWQSLSSIDYDAFLKKSTLSKEQKMFIELLKNFFADPETIKNLQKFLGQEVTIAAYPTDIDLKNIPSDQEHLFAFLQEALGNVFFITRIPIDIQTAEAFSGFLKQNISPQIETTQYKDHTIYAITIPQLNVKLNFVCIKSLLIAGIGDKAVKTSIDVYRKEKLSLAKDPQFAEAQKRFLTPSAMVSFMNLEKIVAGIEDIAKQTASLAKEDPVVAEDLLARYFAQTKGFKTLAMSTQLDPKVFYKVNVAFDKSQMNAITAAIFESCQSAENKSLKLVPHDAVVYYWSNCFNITTNWKQLKEKMSLTTKEKTGQEEVVDQGIKSFEKTLGLSIEEDILPSFGKEVGGYLTDIKITETFPVPQFSFFIKIEDKAKLEHVLSTLIGQLPMNPQKEEYNNVTLNYLTIPAGEGTEPSYCILNDYLLLANNRQLLKSSIDAFTNESLSLTADEKFKEMDFGLKEKSLGVQFVQVDTLMQKVKSLLDWYVQSLNADDQKKTAFRTGTQKRLEDLKVEKTAKQNTLKDDQTQLDDLKKQIAADASVASAASLDAGKTDMRNKQLGDLQTQIDQLNKEITTSGESAQELEKVLKGYEGHDADVETRQFYLDKFFYPVLNALNYLSGYAGKATIEDQNLEFIMTLKIQ